MLKKILTARNKKIMAYLLCFALALAYTVTPRTVYASDMTLRIADCATWDQVARTYGDSVMQWLRDIADSLGMSCSAFCAAVSAGTVALSPYIVGAVAVGASAYLGYDIYANWDTISDQLMTELVGGSAYADTWFTEYAQGILDGTHDLSNGIVVPVDLFNSMTVALSTVLTCDMSSTFAHRNTCVRTSSSAITNADLTSWLSALGFEGDCRLSRTIYNPVICMYDAAAQDYILFVAGAYYNAAYTDLLLTDVAGKMYAQLQNSNIVNDIGYAMQPTSNAGAVWTSIDAATGYTVGLVPEFDLSSLTIADGTITYIHNGATYAVSILCPVGCSVVLGNLTYDELAYPLTYMLNTYTMLTLLPWYWQVTGIAVADMSVLDTRVTARQKVIPQDYVDAIDAAISASDDIPIALPSGAVADWINDDAITDTAVITDAIGTSASDTTIDADMSWLDKLIDFLQRILNGIVSLPQQIADAIIAGLTALFVPSDAAIANIRGLIDDKLPFIGDLSSWVDELMRIMQHPDAYASDLTFAVDMSRASDTFWDWGDSKSNAMSVEWYMDYKGTVDDIIVGIAWLVCLWNLHGQLPSIISALHTGTYAVASLDYQIYSVGARRDKMAKSKAKDGGKQND